MKRALLVIDVQESFRQQPLWEAISNSDIAADVGLLVESARPAGDLVVWILHTEPGTDMLFDPASGLVRFIEPLTPVDGEPVLRKRRSTRSQRRTCSSS